MRAVLQRVSRAGIMIAGENIAEIGAGLLLLLGVHQDDTEADAAWLAEKIVRLRIFADEAGQMNRSLLDAGGSLLVVSQFTLTASTRKGTRPSFNAAAKPEVAVPLYESFVRHAEAALGRPVLTGRFGAMMEVTLVNDGPVTLIVDSHLRE